MWRVLVIVGLCGAVGLGATAVAAADDGGSPRPAATSAVCARLAERVAEVPGIRTRIDDQLDRIESRLAAVAGAARRARLTAQVQPRIDALRALDQRLTALVARVDARCPGIT